MTTRFEHHAAIAAEVLAKTEANKATIKRGTEALNWMYEVVRGEFNDATNYEKCWDIPMQLNHIREAKHAGIFGAVWPRVAELIEMREAIKAIPLIVREAKVENVEAKIVRTLREEIERRKEAFDRTKRAIELFVEFKVGADGRMAAFVSRLSTHVVYCQNSFGTSWVRIDWYLDNRKTAFNSICAAVEQVREERGIK